MPSSITHELIAERAKELLPPDLRAEIDAAADYFYLGAQGPDLFFFYRPLARGGNLGRRLHRGGIHAFFSAMRRALAAREGADRLKCRAYALGFCSHLSADTVFHPFVYRYLGEHPEAVHQAIENDWDVAFLRALRGGDAARYAFPFDPVRIGKEGLLFPFLGEAVRESGDPPLRKGRFRAMLRNFKRYLAFFHGRGRGGMFRALHMRRIAALYPPKEPDPRVLGGAEFTRLSGAENAEELFRRAAEESAARMLEFEACLESGEPLPQSFSRHLLTGEPL